MLASESMSASGTRTLRPSATPRTGAPHLSLIVAGPRTSGSPRAPHARSRGGGVLVEAQLELCAEIGLPGRGAVVVTLTPEPGLRLCSRRDPRPEAGAGAAAVVGAGAGERVTRVRVLGGLAELACAMADRPEHELPDTGLHGYPPGPVTLWLPVEVTCGVPVIAVSYLAAGERGCPVAVTDRRLVLPLP